MRQTKKIFLTHRFFRLFPLSIAFILLFYVNNFNKLDLAFNLTLISNLWWSVSKFPGGWSISSEWIFSIILVVVGSLSKKKVYFLIFISALTSFVLGAFIFLNGGTDLSFGVEQYEFRTWLNTTNPMINIGFFAIGIGIKKNYIKINEINKYLLLTIFFLMVIEDKILGNLMVGWMFALAALLALCLNFKSQSSKFNLVISFIGKRTYGIFFVHFLLLDNSYISNFYRWLEIPQASLVFKILNFVIVFGLSILGGGLTYILIEKPFLVFSKRIEIALKK